jgi:hypothetical protein
MGFLKLLSTAGDFLSWLFSYLHDRKVKNDQQTEDQRDQAVAGLSEIQRADQSRDAVRDQLASDPASVRKPDGHTAARGSDGIS